MHQESKQRQRAGHTSVSEVDSVGASLEGIKLLFRAYKLSQKTPCVCCAARNHHPALSSQETTVSGNPLSGLELHSSFISSKGILTFKMCPQMIALAEGFVLGLPCTGAQRSPSALPVEVTLRAELLQPLPGSH